MFALLGGRVGDEGTSGLCRLLAPSLADEPRWVPRVVETHAEVFSVAGSHAKLEAVATALAAGERRRAQEQCPCSLVAALGLATACEPYQGITKEMAAAGVDLLTAESSVIALEVTACITSGSPPDFEIEGSFEVGGRTDEGDLVVVVENLAIGQRETIDAFSVTYEYAVIDFVLHTDWSGSGRRCSEPEVLEISPEELAADQELTLLNARVQLFVSGSAPGLCGDLLEDGEVSLTIVRLRVRARPRPPGALAHAIRPPHRGKPRRSPQRSASKDHRPRL